MLIGLHKRDRSDIGKLGNAIFRHSLACNVPTALSRSWTPGWPV
jgi:hypothetical protein